MINISYDLHIHSCLSPCGDADMTPANIVGMAALKGLDVIALTDHNSCKNCPAFLIAARDAGLLALPGMEVTTIEEVHVVCLFTELEKAMEFDSLIQEKLLKIENNPAIFGRQEIYNEMDQIIGEEPYLLINSTDISVDHLYDIVKLYGGIMIPAHIDKTSNSMISNLGFIPEDSKFDCVEVHDVTCLPVLRATNQYLNHCNVITNSDAHYLQDINEPKHYLMVNEKSLASILEALERKQEFG